MDRRHDAETVLVTGASRGIGLAVARRYAQLGAKVGMVATDPDRLQRAAAELDAATHTVAADLTDPAECARAVAEVQAALGPVDVLVSCAGILHRDFIEDVTVDDFERSYRLHAGAALWLSQRVLPGMRARRRGAIVLVSSELGIIGVPTYAAYCAGKWGMLGLADVMRHELVGSGVRVCAVCPGDVRTDQLAEEQAWGPTGGQTYDKALDPDAVATAVIRGAQGRRPLIVSDAEPMRTLFMLMAGPRRMRFWPIHLAFRGLLRERRPGDRA
jgi:3-dehydrosphinganine reductase